MIAVNNFELELLIIALLVGISCSIVGSFLVFRGISLVSDAISHAVVFGIVSMFLIFRHITSAMLMIGACCAGLAAVWFIQQLINTGKIKKDAAIGLVFPTFFSLAILLIDSCARSIHLDSDMVLLGEIAFAPLERLVIKSIDIGSYSLWLATVLLIFVLIFLIICIRRLKVAIVDPLYAQTIGIAVSPLYYLHIALTSIVAVCALQMIGAVVMVCFMVVPTTAARLITNNMRHAIGIGCMIACNFVVWGIVLALHFDLSISGSMATVAGVMLLFIFFLSKLRMQ